MTNIRIGLLIERSAFFIIAYWQILCLGESRLRLSIVHVKTAGIAAHNLLPRDVCLVAKEHIFPFHRSHDIRMPGDSFMMKGVTIDYFDYLDEAGPGTLETDDGVQWLHRITNGLPRPEGAFSSAGEVGAVSATRWSAGLCVV